MAKDEVVATVTEIPGKVYIEDQKDAERVPSSQAGHTWTPGLKNQFPVVSCCAILLVLLSCVGVVLVLVLSNNKPVDSWCAGSVRVNLPFGYTYKKTWSIPPSVWISIFVFISGKLTALAFAEAATIAWWTTAMKGTTLGDLIHHWEAGKSITAVFRNPRKFGWICLASIAFTAFAGLGTILQKSTSTVIAHNTFKDVEMSADLAGSFPYRFSGAGDTMSTAYYSPAMLKIVREYAHTTPVHLDVANCPQNNDTKCSATLQGLGFQYTCSQELADYPLYQSPPTKQSNHTLFDVHFDWNQLERLPHQPSQPPRIDWDILFFASWKTKRDCSDKYLTYRSCTLAPAIVEYPVEVSEGIATLAPPSSQPIWEAGSDQSQHVNVDKVARVLPVLEPSTDEPVGGAGEITFNCTTCGIYKFLTAYFQSSILVDVYKSHDFGSSENSIVTGPLTASFAVLDPLDSDNACLGPTMPDPTQFVFSELRDLMFRTSVAIVQDNITGMNRTALKQTGVREPGKCPKVTVTDAHASYTMAQNIYKTDFLFLGLGVALMVVSVAAVLPLFWGFWNLGRKVSLSPLEMAKALNSHATAMGSDQAQPTAASQVGVFEAPELAKTGMNGSNATTKELIELLGDVKVKYGEVAPQTLGLGLEEHVGHPHHGQVYQ